MAIAAALLAACNNTGESPGTNMNANSGNTTAKPPAPPTKEALVAQENNAFNAWMKKDGKFFEGFLTDNFVMFGGNGRIDKAATIKEIAENKCENKSFSFSDEQMTAVGPDVAVITMKVTSDYTCDGVKGPSPVWSASVYVRSGDAWKAAYHAEVPIVDPKAPPKPTSVPKSADDKSKPAADAKPADALTEALLAAERKGWEGWKNRDAKAIEEIVTQNLVFIDPTGRFDKAGALKTWTEPKCEVKSFSFTDAASVSLTKDVGLLTLKSSADGKCEGQTLMPLWNTSLFIKEGDAWKVIFMLENPA